MDIVSSLLDLDLVSFPEDETCLFCRFFGIPAIGQEPAWPFKIGQKIAGENDKKSEFSVQFRQNYRKIVTIAADFFGQF